MIGAIIGDIVGSRFEFDNTSAYDFELFTSHCDYTDDTICTIAIADAIMNERSYRDSLLDWCRRYPHPMGAYGGSFQRWIFSNDPQPYGSYGNGAAMRVSPVAWLFDDPDAIKQEARKSAACTHNHKQGLIGAEAVAMGIYLAKSEQQGSKKDMLDALMNDYYGSDWEAHLPRKGFFDVTCQGCVPLSFHIVKQSTSFEDAIRKAIAYGGDSDTIGAIVGSIAEALYGVDEELKDKAMGYLPDDMKKIVRQFYC